MNIKRFNEIKKAVHLGLTATLSKDVTITIKLSNHHLYCLLLESIEQAETINDKNEEYNNAEYKYLCDTANALMFALSSKAELPY